jgi:hypothetical protein
MHPGELRREEILPALDRPKTEIAKLLGVSRQTLYDILDEGQPGHPSWRYGLASCAETVPISGSIRRGYDLDRAQRELGEKIKAIPTLRVA